MISSKRHISIDIASDQAEMLAQVGKHEQAEAHYRTLIAQTNEVAHRYDDWCRQLGQLYKVMGRWREAGHVYLYLHEFTQAADCFERGEDPSGVARCYEAEKRWQEAAVSYQRAGLFAHAAVALEKSDDFEQAADHWRRLKESPHLRTRSYELALVHVNYGMAAARLEAEAAAGMRALIEAQRRLEQVADEFVTRGERERAFDCYQVLLYLGRESQQFENLSEGYLNCIRVLKYDNLKFYALQYYEDFARLAVERKEYHAAATIFQEAAEYAQRSALPYYRYFTTKAAEIWETCGDKHLDDGAPLEMVENAFLAAIACHSSVGDYRSGVGRVFRRLAGLELADKKRDRYAGIAQRYVDAQDAGEVTTFPDYLKHNAYADIWFVDVLEWELRGDPRSVGSAIVGNKRYPDSIRRGALSLVLLACDAELHDRQKAVEIEVEVAAALGELQSYVALYPLEVLFESQEHPVREAVLLALRFLHFKRSFVIIRRGLEDPEPSVREAALKTLQVLHFPRAFNPLAGIYRESDDLAVRTTALQAIGKIDTIEAGVFLVEVLRQEEGHIRDVATEALAQSDDPNMKPILKQYFEIETNEDARARLGRLSGRRVGGRFMR